MNEQTRTWSELAVPILDHILDTPRTVVFEGRDDTIYAQIIVNEHPPLIVDLGTDYMIDGDIVWHRTNQLHSKGITLEEGETMTAELRLVNYDYSTDGHGGDQSLLQFETA